MKGYPILMLVFLGLCGCDSIKKSVIQTDKSVEKLSVAVNEQAASSGAIQSLSETEFEPFIGQTGKLVVVDFHADWCGPCKQLAPIMDKLAVEYGDRMAVGKVDVDKQGAIAERLAVEGIPDLRFYLDGKQVDKIVGLPPEGELRSRIDRHLQPATAAVPAAKADEPQAKQETPKPENIVGNAIRKAGSGGPVAEKPKDVPKPAPVAKKPKETTGAKEPAKPKEPEKPKEPAIQPMKKDWMPPGMQRKGG